MTNSLFGGKFAKFFSPNMWKTHPAVLPLVAIMAIGVGWATTFGTYSLMYKPEVDLTKRPRHLGVSGHQKMIDSRNYLESSEQIQLGVEREELLELRKEIYAVYYPIV